MHISVKINDYLSPDYTSYFEEFFIMSIPKLKEI